MTVIYLGWEDIVLHGHIFNDFFDFMNNIYTVNELKRGHFLLYNCLTTLFIEYNALISYTMRNAINV